MAPEPVLQRPPELGRELQGHVDVADDVGVRALLRRHDERAPAGPRAVGGGARKRARGDARLAVLVARGEARRADLDLAEGRVVVRGVVEGEHDLVVGVDDAQAHVAAEVELRVAVGRVLEPSAGLEARPLRRGPEHAVGVAVAADGADDAAGARPRRAEHVHGLPELAELEGREADGDGDLGDGVVVAVEVALVDPRADPEVADVVAERADRGPRPRLGEALGHGRAPPAAEPPRARAPRARRRVGPAAQRRGDAVGLVARRDAPPEREPGRRGDVRGEALARVVGEAQLAEARVRRAAAAAAVLARRLEHEGDLDLAQDLVADDAQVAREARPHDPEPQGARRVGLGHEHGEVLGHPRVLVAAAASAAALGRRDDAAAELELDVGPPPQLPRRAPQRALEAPRVERLHAQHRRVALRVSHAPRPRRVVPPPALERRGPVVDEVRAVVAEAEAARPVVVVAGRAEQRRQRRAKKTVARARPARLAARGGLRRAAVLVVAVAPPEEHLERLVAEERLAELRRAVRARQVGQRRRVEARGVRDGGRRVVAELDGVRGREDLVAQQPQQLRRALVAGAPRERLERAAAQRDLPTSRVPARVARKNRRRARRAPRPRGGRTCRRRPRPRRRAAARTSRCRRGT